MPHLQQLQGSSRAGGAKPHWERHLGGSGTKTDWLSASSIRWMDSATSISAMIIDTGKARDPSSGQIAIGRGQRRHLRKTMAWQCASTASCAAGARRHWMNGSTMPLTLSSRRSCASPAFCAGISMPSKMQSNSPGATVKRKGNQPPQDAETSNVRSRRPRTDEGENAAADSQNLRMNPIKCQATARSKVKCFNLYVVLHSSCATTYRNRWRVYGEQKIFSPTLARAADVCRDAM